MNPTNTSTATDRILRLARGAPSRTARVTGVDGTAEPEDHWSFDTGSVLGIKTEPLTVPLPEGPATIVGSSDGLHAIDDVGGELWTLETDGLIGATPAIATLDDEDGPTVYAPCVDDTLYAVDAGSGDVRWTADIDGGHSSPAVADGTVYVGSDDDSLYAVDAASGDVQWSFETDGMVRSSPAIADGTLYVGSSDGRLYALDAEDGTQEWAADDSGIRGIETTPAVADGTVYVAAGRALHAFDAEDGEKRFDFDPSPADTVFSPAVGGGMVVFGCANTGLYGLDAESGEKQWVFAGDDAMGAPILADGTAVVGSADRSLYGVDVRDGEETWSIDIGESVSAGPALLDGVYAVGTTDGNVHTFRSDDAETSATEFGSNAVVDAPTVDAISGTTDWEATGGTPGRTGHRDGTGPMEAVSPRWEFETGYKLHDQLGADDRGIYVGDRNYDVLRAFDLDGTERWTADLDGTVATAPVVADGMVYVGTVRETLFAIDAESGETLWSAGMPGRMAAPTIGGDTAYLSAGSAFLAVDVETGDRTWEIDLGGVRDGSPLLAFGTLYLSAAGTLYALDPATGTERFALDGDEGYTQAATDGDMLFVGTESGSVHGLDPETGERTWVTEVDGTPRTPAVDAGRVFVATDSGSIAALDSGTGERAWAYDASAALSRPAVDGKTVFVGSDDGNLYAVDAGTGEERYFFEVDGSTGQPLVADDTVAVVAGGRGAVVLESREETSREAVDPDTWAVRGGDLGATNHAGGGGPVEDTVDGAWTVDVGGIEGEAIVEGGVAYVATGNRSVDAYDLATGDELWSADLDKAPKAAPVVADGSVYVGTSTGVLYALDSTTGDRQWTFEATASGFSHFETSPAVDPGGDTVFVGSTDEHLYAVDTETGEQRWTFHAEHELTAAPVVAGGTVYTAGYDVYAIDVASGTKRWSYSPQNQEVTGLAYEDGTLVAGTTGGVVHGIDAERGTGSWTHRADRRVSPPAAADGRAYVTSGEAVSAIDTDGGAVEWTHEVDGRTSISPAIAEGVVYAIDGNSSLLAIENGEKLWSTDLGNRPYIAGSPTISDGAAVVADEEGTLLSFVDPGVEPTGAPESMREAAAGGAGDSDTASTDGTAGASSEGPADADSESDAEFISTAATDTEDPSDEQIQEAILGALCDEWTDSNRNVRLSLEEIAERVATVIPHATEGLVRHNVTRLAENAYVGFERAYETVTLRARGAGRYQNLSDTYVVPERQLLEVLEPLYERARENPNASQVSREELLEATYLDPDELDRTIWLLKDIGIAMGDVYLDAGGYIEVHAVGGSPWWRTAYINRFGKDLYEELS